MWWIDPLSCDESPHRTQETSPKIVKEKNSNKVIIKGSSINFNINYLLDSWKQVFEDSWGHPPVIVRPVAQFVNVSKHGMSFTASRLQRGGLIQSKITALLKLLRLKERLNPDS